MLQFMRVNTKTAFILICSFIFLFSCNDPSDVGSELLDQDGIDVIFVDTVSMNVKTVKGVDSIRTNGFGRVSQDLYLGEIRDDYFGFKKFDSYFQVSIASVPPSFYNYDTNSYATVDSIVLLMNMTSGLFYGDTSAQHNIQVFEIDQDLDDNEELYTTTSNTSYEKFKKNPELFEQYHEGFRHQVESWPENPVDVIVRQLTSKFKQNSKSKTEKCVVADFGCGDAQLAKDLLAVKRKKKQNVFHVHSFDLVAPNELVTACDMANVPLENKSVDVCVFCLSLMGTNLADFIREAHRVLKDDGIVKIAEVRSRIEYSHNRKNKNGNKDSTEKTEGTLEEFTDVLAKLGFQCIQTDRSNTMFLMLDLKKNGKKPDKKLEFSAKPCIYKRR